MRTSRNATRFNPVWVEHLNPFLNSHRPCLFATARPDPGKPGRIKRVYRVAHAMTPLDKRSSLPNASTCLLPPTYPNITAIHCKTSTTDRLASRHPSQTTPGSYPIWKRLAQGFAAANGAVSAQNRYVRAVVHLRG